jgi:hypothetical protein
MTPNDTAKLGTNETASACFRDPGYVRYTVRMESGLTTGELNVPGVVKVGGQGGQAAAQTSDQKSGRTSDPSSDRISSPRSSTSTTTSTTTTTEGASGPTTDQTSNATRPPQ